MWFSTKNYLWSTEDLIGHGGFGYVYKGTNKTTGELVAIKSFKPIEQGYDRAIINRYLNLQKREFGILESVNHENVVKLLAIEENRKREKVIVMQLCTGGSLQDVIDHPENVYGLNENEFLIVLNHITAGMRYLRAKNLVHRDLKPANIMRFVRDDGRIIYKLGDFGAARELNDNEVFQSFCGTYDYLHPDLFGAVYRFSQNCSFGATIDLWSIAVTLYQVATGDLPFQAYRRESRQMYTIISTKPSGVIAGIQRTSNGHIDYSRNLPNTCQLSYGLKVLLTPILAGLLEADLRKSWNFDKYFDAVDNILSRQLINIFCLNQARTIKVYLHPNENYQNFQNYIHEQTGIPPNNQIFVFKSKLIVNLIGVIDTTDKEPLYLFDKNNNEITASVAEDLPIFSNFAEQICQQTYISKGKKACSIGYICKRRIEQYCLVCQHFTNAVMNFNQFIVNELKELKQLSNLLWEKNMIIEKILPIISAYEQRTSSSSLFSSINGLQENFQDFRDKITKLYQDCVGDGCLENKWNEFVELLEQPWKNRASERVNTEVERLEVSWKYLTSSPCTSHNNQQFYKLERIKIVNTLERTTNLLQEVHWQYCQLTGKFNDLYQMLKTLLSELTVLKKGIIQFRKDFQQTELKIENNFGKLQQFPQPTTLPGHSNRTKIYEKLKTLFDNYNNQNGEIRAVLEENNLLRQTIGGILQTINVQIEIQLEQDPATTTTTAIIDETVNIRETQDILTENSSLIPEIEQIIEQINHDLSTLSMI